MKAFEPWELHNQLPKNTILYSSGQLQGIRDNQEDYTGNFNDEFFVVADGVESIPNGEIAAKFAGETAVWAYKQIRTRHFYWQDKKKFIERIFRTSNIAIWQKQRETGFGDGLATTLAVSIIGAYNFWVGTVGDSRIYLYHDHTLNQLTVDDVNDQGILSKMLGIKRYGLIPKYNKGRFMLNDVMLLTTSGLTNFISREEIEDILKNTGNTQEQLDRSTQKIINNAKINGGNGNMSITFIKRIPIIIDDNVESLILNMK
jgi:PPM family protein phosphatase